MNFLVLQGLALKGNQNVLRNSRFEGLDSETGWIKIVLAESELPKEYPWFSRLRLHLAHYS